MIRNRYLDTCKGQMHVMSCGEGPTVVLLHWSPRSGRMYLDEMEPLAARGYQVIAPDLISFGRSAMYDYPPTPAEQARALVEGLTDMGVSRCSLLGAHVSATVAAEIAAENLLKVDAIVFDGITAFLPNENINDIQEKVGFKRELGCGLKADGSHTSHLWDLALAAHNVFDPNFEVNDKTIHVLYRWILDYMSTGMPTHDFGRSHPFEMEAKLRAIEAPICLVTADTDPLRPTVPVAQAIRPDSHTVVIGNGHPLHNPDRAGEYANVLADFIDKHLS